MKKILTMLMALLFCSAAVCSPVHGGVDTKKDDAISVLFIGNSMTHFNDMPALFERHVHAVRPNMRVHIEVLAPNGAALVDHMASGVLSNALAQRHWDYVVLQERSLASVWSLDGEAHYDPPEAFIEGLAKASRLVREAGAVPVLYQTAGRWSEPDKFSYYDYAFMQAARSSEARLAPVGRVWMELHHQHAIRMDGPDGIHPTVAASHAAALSIANTLLGVEAADDDVEISGISSAQWQRIRQVAAKHAARLRDAGGYESIARPAYRNKPAPPQSDKPLLAHAQGVWRAHRGGTRLSHGTELHINIDNGAPKVEVREFTSSGIVFPAVTLHAFDDRGLDIGFKSGNVDFRLFAALKGEDMVVLSVRGLGQAREEYSNAIYRQGGEAEYFNRLEALYAQFQREEEKEGLARALRQHHVRLLAELGAEEVARARQGFDLATEWEPILAAWHYEAIGNQDRALAFYQAGIELFPDAVDAHSYYADALAKLGRKNEAKAEYQRALELLPAQQVQLRIALDIKIGALSK